MQSRVMPPFFFFVQCQSVCFLSLEIGRGFGLKTSGLPPCKLFLGLIDVLEDLTCASTETDMHLISSHRLLWLPNGLGV